MTRLHDQDHFYKYVTLDGLRCITGRLSRQWTAPSEFNDAFDTQFDLGYKFAIEEFGPAFIAEMESVVYGDEEPTGDPSHPLLEQLLVARSNRHRRTREDFRRFFAPTIEKTMARLPVLQAFASLAWKRLHDRIRILCVTETHRNRLMWAHYAENHKGAVVQLGCIPERDSVLLAAVPVTYSDQPPFIGTLGEWVKQLTGQISIDYDGHFSRLVMTKSTEWSYEKEWRCINFAPPGDSNPHMYDQFWPEEIQAVYFGCRTPDTDIADIMASLHPSLGHTTVYRATRRQWEYQLDFVPIDR